MKIVDLKKVEKEQGVHSKELAYREVQLLPAISNSHIIKYYHYFEKDSFLYILTEYIRNGDMSDLIDIRRELKIPFKEEELWDIFYQWIWGKRKPSPVKRRGYDKQFVDFLGSFKVDGAVADQHATESRNRVASQSINVGLLDGRAAGQTTRIVVFEDGESRLIELADEIESRVKVE